MRTPAGGSASRARPLVRVLLLACIVGACGEGPTDGMEPEEGGDPPPAVFDWVGTWKGQATGLDRGVPVDDTVTLVISFDRHEECRTCVRVVLGHLFDRDSLLITDPVRTELSYVDAGGRERRLELQRFSTGDGAGRTILGRAEVRSDSNAPGTGELLYSRDITLRKDVR